MTAALRFEPVAFEAGHVLDYDIAPSLPVRGDGANMMAIGAGFTGELLALEMVDVFLNTPFSEGERHARRVAKVNAIQP